MMRWGLPLLAALSLGLAISWVLSVRPVSRATAPLSPPPEAPSGQWVAAVGLVEPESETIELSCAVPGLITAVQVHSGDHVKSGQPLFSVDARSLRADLRVRRAGVETAKARLAKLESEPRPEAVAPFESRVAEAKALLEDAAMQVRLIENVSDRRAVKEEDVLHRRLTLEAAKARLDRAEKELALARAGAWAPDLAVAKAAVTEQVAAAGEVEAQIARLTVTAPVAGTILRSKVRLGQYAQCGVPLMLMGGGARLHVRAEVDESEAAKVLPGAAATASPRGHGQVRMALEFVRIEPLVAAKKALAGDSAERVDTRVLQVIFRFHDANPRVFNGQQMDVYIEAGAAW